jgi:SAM-dependent methyltransferase
MTADAYTGGRILEAMHEAVRYSGAVAGQIERAWPAGANSALEFGAGDGMFLRRFRAGGKNVDCVEIDQALRRGLGDAGCRIFGNIREVESGSYDFIYSVNVLEHISDLVGEIAELKRVLRPGGELFVFVPAFRLLWTSLDTEVGHVTRFTRSSLSAALRGGGFRVTQMSYFDSLGFPAALAVRFLERLNLFSYGGGTVGFYDRYVFPLSRTLDCALSPILGKNLVARACRD